MEVGEQGVRGEHVQGADVDLSSVPQEPAFAHVRQEAELVLILPFQIKGPLSLGEDAQGVRWSQT